MAWMGSTTRTLESFYYQKKDGVFVGEMFDSWIIQFVDLFGYQGAREYWALRKHQFSAEFVSYVDEQIATVTPSPLYSAEAFDAPPGENDSA